MEKITEKPLHFHLLYESDTKLNAVLSSEFLGAGTLQKLHVKYSFLVSSSLSIHHETPAYYTIKCQLRSIFSATFIYDHIFCHIYNHRLARQLGHLCFIAN